MRHLRIMLSSLAIAFAVSAVMGLAGPAHAAPDPNNTTDAFRTGGCTGCFITQMNAVVAQFQEITRVFRGCYANGGIKNDGSSCGSGAPGVTTSSLADFVVIQGILKNSNTDTNHLGVPNGPSLGQVTYRVSANGSGNGVNCAKSSPTAIGFLAPEGFDGAPNTSDDAGCTGGACTVGTPGNGQGANTATMIAAPLVNCQNKTKVETFETVGGTTNTFLTAPNGELCIVNYDLSGNGSIANDQTGSGAPGFLKNLTTKSDNTAFAGNESTNLSFSCDTAFADLPTGDFSPPKPPFVQPDTFGAQIFKLAVSRDMHAASGANNKIHIIDPQMENLFGEPQNLCDPSQIGAVGTPATPGSGLPMGTSNLTACIRAAGSGSRETFRLTWMANTEGSKTQSEDPPVSGNQQPNGTLTSCDVLTESGGDLFANKRIKVNNGNDDVVNCLATYSSSVGYIDADRFDAGFYGGVVEGVDPDAAVLAPAASNLKKLVSCGQYRWWGPLSGGVGGHNPGGSAFITAHRAALKNPVVYTTALAYLPNDGIAIGKGATDAAYGINFAPTTQCPGAPPAELTISASPTTKP